MQSNRLIALTSPKTTNHLSCVVEVRFIMKGHAFVREKAGQVIEKAATKEEPTIEFSNYLYFQFVPTLVYRDKYPRYVLFAVFVVN